MIFDDKHDSARPYIASYILLERDGKIAMLLRKNTGWMDGYYGLPAGKVEYGETYKQGAVREAKEEVGVTVELQDLELVHIAHRHGENETHFMDWVDVFFRAKKWHGEACNAEPDKSEKLEWLEVDNLPGHVVPSQKAALDAIKSGVVYGEFGWE